MRLIETDAFPFEFLSHLAERESWRKEIHRPIYHVHKWWAKRLGSVFRGILLGAALPADVDLPSAFYKTHRLSSLIVFDPFMGSGTTIGEAHKLGCVGLGRDINAVAVESTRTAFGPMDRRSLEAAFQELSRGAGEKIRSLYRSEDASGAPCDVLYFFWAMQAPCPDCRTPVDFFSSWIIARNAYPSRKPEVQILCPACGDIFPGLNHQETATCRSCGEQFDPRKGPAKGTKATCRHCHHVFPILAAMVATGEPPKFRLYGKLVLTATGAKEYLPATAGDLAAYQGCSAQLREEVARGEILLPSLGLEQGHNTRQAMNYGFKVWRDFFNDRQLLALGYLRAAISRLADAPTREALLTLFSGALEFNNMFASYKGEGTGAVRHMFSHHILKPERAPIEANVWGTPKSSGSFSGLFRGRLLRAIDYRLAPAEVKSKSAARRVCSPPFSEIVEPEWPTDGQFKDRGIYLSCGDSAATGLPDGSVDLVVTDPPFFDNVHYSELADFFYAWRLSEATTRRAAEVQDADAVQFASKLRGVFQECHRVLKDNGLLVFTYHHSRDEGWKALANALLGSGFTVVNSHPVKAEMSVATPKSQAKNPIQLDIILICRKSIDAASQSSTMPQATAAAKDKIRRLLSAGFDLSRNDRRIVFFGQLLTTMSSPKDTERFKQYADDTALGPDPHGSSRDVIESQLMLFGDTP